MGEHSNRRLSPRRGIVIARYKQLDHTRIRTVKLSKTDVSYNARYTAYVRSENLTVKLCWCHPLHQPAARQQQGCFSWFPWEAAFRCQTCCNDRRFWTLLSQLRKPPNIWARHLDICQNEIGTQLVRNKISQSEHSEIAGKKIMISQVTSQLNDKKATEDKVHRYTISILKLRSLTKKFQSMMS